jgi:hypothetical protein
MQLVLEIGYYAELATAAPKGPEQVGILLLAGGQKIPIGRDNVGADQVVTGHSV